MLKSEDVAIRMQINYKNINIITKTVIKSEFRQSYVAFLFNNLEYAQNLQSKTQMFVGSI